MRVLIRSVVACALLVFPVALPTLAVAATAAGAGVAVPDDPRSLGTLGGQALEWVIAIVAGPIAAAFVHLLMKIASGVGLSIDDTRRARLQQMVENGLHAAAAEVAKDVDGKIPVQFKSQLMGNVVRYVLAHGADTLKALGLKDLTNATDAIEARVEKALADPTVPIEVSPDPAGGDPVMQKLIADAVDAKVAELLKKATPLPPAPSPVASPGAPAAAAA